jgi:pimeloyl-ACP methyl ester carboxylesterase
VHFSDLGSGPVLILLHANPGDHRDFNAVMPALAQNHRVIALDWPGYGLSPALNKPNSVDVLYYYQIFTEFVAALGLKTMSILGNSVGGNIAARFAANFPDKVRKLVLVAPGGFTKHDFITRSFCKLQGSPLSMPPSVWARLYLRKRTPVTAEMLTRAKTVQAEADCLKINRALWRSFARTESDLLSLCNSIQAPVLLIFGEKDPAISAKKDGNEAVKAIPHAKRIILPCGHAPFAEMPAEFLRHVEPFLSERAQLG